MGKAQEAEERWEKNLSIYKGPHYWGHLDSKRNVSRVSVWGVRRYKWSNVYSFFRRPAARHILCRPSAHSMALPWDWDPAEVWLLISACAATWSALSLLVEKLFLNFLPVFIKSESAAFKRQHEKCPLRTFLRTPLLAKQGLWLPCRYFVKSRKIGENIILHVYSTCIFFNQNEMKPRFNGGGNVQVGVRVLVCGRAGLSRVEARPKSGQACFPTEFKRRENKQKDERNGRIHVDRGRNTVIPGCLFEHHAGEEEVTVGFRGTGSNAVKM